jgi:PTS system nitrogen regulatory IIA component
LYSEQRGEGGHAVKLIELLAPGGVIAELAGRDIPSVLAELSAPVASASGIAQHSLVDALLAREALGSTGIGEGVALPHTKHSALEHVTASFARSHGGIAFGASDGRPVHLFVALFAPSSASGIHLKALARASQLLASAPLRQALLEACDADELERLLADAERGL